MNVPSAPTLAGPKNAWSGWPGSQPATTCEKGWYPLPWMVNGEPGAPLRGLSVIDGAANAVDGTPSRANVNNAAAAARRRTSLERAKFRHLIGALSVFPHARSIAVGQNVNARLQDAPLAASPARLRIAVEDARDC